MTYTLTSDEGSIAVTDAALRRAQCTLTVLALSTVLIVKSIV